MITKVRADAKISRRMALFSFEENGNEGCFFIRRTGETYEIVARSKVGTTEQAETVLSRKTWVEAIGTWNELAAQVVERMDKDTVFTGHQVQALTGISAPSVTKVAQNENIRPVRLGRTLLYSRNDLITFFRRSVVEGRPAGGDQSRARIIGDALALDPSRIPERDRRMLEQHYGLNGERPHSLVEIGDRNNVSKERVRQVVNRSIDRVIMEDGTKAKRRDILAREKMSIAELFGVDLSEEHHEQPTV